MHTWFFLYSLSCSFIIINSEESFDEIDEVDPSKLGISSKQVALTTSVFFNGTFVYVHHSK